MRPSASIIAALALASSVSAEIFTTAPVASTTCNAGQPCPVRWNDDGKAPALKDIGPCEIALFTGGAQQQTFLQMIQPEVDVSTLAEVTFLPEAGVGENGPYYFIRFQSKNLKSTANPAYPYQSFSAKFTLQGMSGQFNATVKGQIDGTSAPSASLPASSAPASSPAASGSAPPKVTTSVASSGTASRATASASSTAKASSAGAIAPITGFLSSAGALVTAAGALLGMVAVGL